MPDRLGVDEQVLLLVSASLLVILVSTKVGSIASIVSTFFCRMQLQFTLLFQKPSKLSGKIVVTSLHIYPGVFLFSLVFVLWFSRMSDSPIFDRHSRVPPVKSLRAVDCETSKLGEKGFVGDRRFMLVTPAPTPMLGFFGPHDATHRFLTQRQCPSLATVVAKLENNDKLTLSSHLLPNRSVSLSVQPVVDSPMYRAGLWSDIVRVQDMGDAAAHFLQAIVDHDENVPTGVRLVVQCPADHRVTNAKYVPRAARSWTGQAPSVGLTDGFPILLANEASLRELNRRLEKKGKRPLPMARFRPNIVVSGRLEPFGEDRWKVIRIGGSTLFHIAKGCPRCKQACTDQTTGEVDEEPLATLSEFRVMTGNQENIYFAQNVLPSPSAVGATISVGDTVEVLQQGDPVWDY